MVSSNCAAPQFPTDIVMMFEHTVERAERNRRSGGSRTPILAHHIIQSFAPGEVDPNLAHDLGVELIEKITGGSHDYVVATHQDRSHIHNHIMFNPVNRKTLRRYRMHKGRARQFRKLSNRLTEPLGLSVTREWYEKPDAGISPSLGEIYAATKGQSHTQVLALKIDRAISEATSWQSMKDNLAEMHVEVEFTGNNVLFRDTTTMKRAVRGRRLGAAYTEAAIMSRLGRETTAEYVVQPSLIDNIDEHRMRVRIPGKKPPTFLTIFDDQVNWHDKHARMYLSEAAQLTLTDKRGNYAGQITASELYQWFTIPDPIQGVREMTTTETRRGLTRRQQAYYWHIDRKVQRLRDDVAVANIVTDYRHVPSDKQADYLTALQARVDTLRQDIDTLVISRQHRHDTGHSATDIDVDITDRTRTCTHLEKAINEINPQERKPRR